MWFMGHDCCAPIYLRGTRILHLQTVSTNVITQWDRNRGH